MTRITDFMYQNITRQGEVTQQTRAPSCLAPVFHIIEYTRASRVLYQWAISGHVGIYSHTSVFFYFGRVVFIFICSK